MSSEHVDKATVMSRETSEADNHSPNSSALHMNDPMQDDDTEAGKLDIQNELLHGRKRKRDESRDEFGPAELANGTSHGFHDGHPSKMTEMAMSATSEIDSPGLRGEVGADDDGYGENLADDEAEQDSAEENVNETENGVDLDGCFTEELNERHIFSASAFTSDEVAKVEPIMRKAIEIPLAKIEKEGYGAYQEFLRERGMKRSKRSEEQERNAKRAIHDSAINGDPRDYQRIFFQIAKTRNTIIHLGTGFGKTLIALLCIRHFSPDFSSGRQTLFLVPSVALAVQQTMTLRANLPGFKIATACYASSHSMPSRQGFSKANVIVATHGALLDLLMHYGDIVNMSKFNLLVIDECHYATGNHAYSIIMRKFYHSTPKDERPRVLGLTASPLVNVKETHSDEHLTNMLRNLEQILDSTLVSFSGLNLDQESRSGLFRRSAEEHVIQYRGRTNIARSIPSAQNLPLHPSRYREFRQLEGLYQDLGALLVSIYSKTLAREISRNSYDKESTQQFACALKHLNDVSSFCSQECLVAPYGGRTDKLLALEELLEEQIEEHGGAETVGLVFVERRITAMALHNYFVHRSKELDKGKWSRAGKMRRMQYCLESEDVDDGGQFADAQEELQRDAEMGHRIKSAKSPRDHFCEPGTKDDDQFIDADEEFEYTFLDASNTAPDAKKPTTATDLEKNAGVNRRNDIRTSVLVRNSTQIFKTLCMSRKLGAEVDKEIESSWIHRDSKVYDVLNSLRRKASNILIATSVVEEGVDVQACSFVAVFDSLRNTKGYIQMKGRARQKDAKFFVFHDTKLPASKSRISLSSAQAMERRVQDFIEMHSQRSVIPLRSTHIREDDWEACEPRHEELVALETGSYRIDRGTVDVLSAKSLLNRYNLSVPLDPFARSSRESLLAHMPVYDENQLILPSHLPRDVRVVNLPKKYLHLPKKEKHKMMALMACVRLHLNGLLNDRLLPLTRKDMQTRVLKVATRELETVPFPHPAIEKAFAGRIETLHMYPIIQTSDRLNRFKSSLNCEGRALALVTLDPIKEIPPFYMTHSEFGLVNNSLGKEVVVTCNAMERSILADIFLLFMNQRWRRRSRNMPFRVRNRDELSHVIAPYYVGVISCDGKLDWDLMNLLLVESRRSLEERTQSVLHASEKAKLLEPRLWSPCYDNHVSYIAYCPSGKTCQAKFPHTKEGVDTYQDYFQRHRGTHVPATSALFHAQRLWTLPSNLPISQLKDAPPAPVIKSPEAGSEMCKELACVMLPQAACCETTLANAGVALLCFMLPQFLYFFERCSIAHAFVDHCKKHLPTLGCKLERLPILKLANALTAKSCSLEDSYDKLEWLGDAVLKLVQTDSLLKSTQLRQWIPFLHEGDLSALRSVMGSNDTLEKTCIRLRFDNFVLTKALARGKWIPACFEYSEGAELISEGSFARKVYADMVESILGLVYIEFGYGVSLKVADELQVTLPWDNEMGDNSDNRTEHIQFCETIRRCTGYDGFKHKELAVEAFTHPSALHPSVPSYQRLEWIGDAVLCLTAREWILANFPDRTLGEMVVMEAALVANETLAFLSMKYGLHQNLNHRDQSLPARIESYDFTVRELGRGLWATNPPKCISDIVEAVLGAVHVDGGFPEGRKATLQVLDPIVSFLRQARRDRREVSVKHPKKVLQEMGGEILELSSATESEFALCRVDTLVWFGRHMGEADREGTNYIASIELLGSCVLALADGSPVVARNRACALMVAFLENNPEIFARFKECRYNIESNMYQALKDDNDEAFGDSFA